MSNARKRVRQAVREEIVEEARRHLAAEGAAALSLRAVARDLGMASSAIYRYFRSRDELLTALIIDAYDAMGAAAEAAACGDGPFPDRFRSVCRAVRGWALAHPHEYALVYGTPVPGYHAPELTVASASRVTLVLSRLLTEAHRAGDVDAARLPPVSARLADEVAPVGATMPEVPAHLVARGLAVWVLLFGQLNFEVFGRFGGVVQDSDVLFEFAVDTMLDLLGTADRSVTSG